MEHPEEPTWLSIEGLALLASMIGARVEGARDKHEMLSLARPSVLHDATVDRLFKGYGDTVEDLWLYDEGTTSRP